VSAKDVRAGIRRWRQISKGLWVLDRRRGERVRYLRSETQPPPVQAGDVAGLGSKLSKGLRKIAPILGPIASFIPGVGTAVGALLSVASSIGGRKIAKAAADFSNASGVLPPGYAVVNGELVATPPAIQQAQVALNIPPAARVVPPPPARRRSEVPSWAWVVGGAVLLSIVARK